MILVIETDGDARLFFARHELDAQLQSDLAAVVPNG